MLLLDEHVRGHRTFAFQVSSGPDPALENITNLGRTLGVRAALNPSFGSTSTDSVCISERELLMLGAKHTLYILGASKLTFIRGVHQQPSRDTLTNFGGELLTN